MMLCLNCLPPVAAKKSRRRPSVTVRQARREKSMGVEMYLPVHSGICLCSICQNPSQIRRTAQERQGELRLAGKVA